MVSPARRGRFLEGRSICLPHTPTVLSLHADTHLNLGASHKLKSCKLLGMDVISVLKRDEEPHGQSLCTVPSAGVWLSPIGPALPVPG